MGRRRTWVGEQYMINLIIIYDVVNIFSMKKFKSLRKLRVGVNRYMGVYWSITTSGRTGSESKKQFPGL